MIGGDRRRRFAVGIVACVVVLAVIGPVTVGQTAATTGENEPPLASAGLDQTVSKGATVYLDARGSTDPDGTIQRYEWSIETPNGVTTTPDCETCATTSFQATATGTYNVTVTVTDDDGASSSDTLKVTVEATNPPAVTLSGPSELAVGASGTLSADVTAGEAELLRAEWYLDGAQIDEQQLTSPTDHLELDHTFTTTGTREVRLEVIDTRGLVTTETHSVDVRGPTAEAPANRTVRAGETVVLAGSGRGPAGPLSYEWSETGSTALTIADPASRRTAVTVPEVDTRRTYQVDLTVQTPSGATDTDSTTLTVLAPPNAAASAAPTAFAGDPVTLDASGSTDPDGTITSYEWDVDGDGDFEHAGMFVTHAYAAGTRTATVRITDGDGQTDTASVTIGVDAKPTATLAANRTRLASGGAVAFGAAGSTDPDGAIQRYAWDFDGDGVTDATGRAVTHRYGVAGTYDARLTVTDTDGYTDTASRTITVQAAPTADAGPDKTVTDGETVTYDASGSTDTDGTITGYEWDLDGDGTYEQTGETVSHAYSSHGTHTATVRVTDDDGLTDTDSVETTVLAKPVAKASADDTTIYPGDTVDFDGTSSYDPDGSITSYAWDFDGDGSVDATGPTPSHSFSEKGTYYVELTVTDNDGFSADRKLSETTTVTIEVQNRAPTADAGSDRTVEEGDTVTLVGSGSSDPDGDWLSYDWSDSSSDIDVDSTSKRTSFTAPSVTGKTTYEITLRVSDGQASDSDTIQVTVKPDNNGNGNSGSHTFREMDPGDCLTNPCDDFAYKTGPDTVKLVDVDNDDLIDYNGVDEVFYEGDDWDAVVTMDDWTARKAAFNERYGRDRNEYGEGTESDYEEEKRTIY